MPQQHPVKVWQEHGQWCVQSPGDGKTMMFKTRDEAISYSTSTFVDGPSAARAEIEGGDVVQGKSTRPRQSGDPPA